MLALLLSLAAADAKCAMPSPFVAGMGSVLPEDPVLWVFSTSWPDDLQVTVTVDGAPATARAELASFGDGRDRAPATSALPDPSGVLALTLPEVRVGERMARPSFVAWRVAIDAPVGSVVAVTMQGATETGTVRDQARMAPSEAVTVEDLGVLSTSWTCSFERTRRLRPSADAPAWRVEWATTEQAWKDGERHTAIMPSEPRQWFSHGRQDLPPEIAIGHLNCAGWTVTWEGPIWATVVGLYPDGSETTAPKAPTRIGAPPR